MSGISLKIKVASLVSLVTVFAYFFITMVIVAPAGEFKSAFKGVTSASSPFLSQKWNVFAPNIMKTNSTLRIQAQWVGDDGKLVKSEWVNITLIEQNSVPGHAIPSRIQKSSWNALLAYNKRYAALDSEQKKIVRDTFIERHKDGYRAKLAADQIEQLTEAGNASRARVVQLLRYDNMLKRYTADFATAYFDKDIVRVRWQIERTRPNDFDHRFDADPQFETSNTTFGWRQISHEVDPEVIAIYEDVIERYAP